MNRAAENLLGIRFSEVVSRPVEFAIRDKTLLDQLKSTLETQENIHPFDFELPGKKHDPSRIMRARTSVISDRDRNMSGIVTIISDVTHEREIDRMKTEFISTAAHELRTPLTSVQGFSELLLARDDLDEKERKKFLGYISKQAVSLAKIVNDLLDLSRLESGKGFAINTKPCDPGNIIRKTVPYFANNSEQHTFETVLPDGPAELLADPDKLDQVLKNLISNAVKFSPEGGIIRVTGEIAEHRKHNAELKPNPKPETEYRISVQDQGIGMSPEQVEKIFDKFYRADASHSAPEGTGLGMTIVKHIVEAHSGKIWVESEIGKGTAVRFTIPAKHSQDRAPGH